MSTPNTPRGHRAGTESTSCPAPAAVVLGHTLAAARRAQDLTRGAVARALGRDARTVTRLEAALMSWPGDGFSQVLDAYRIAEPAQREGLAALAHATDPYRVYDVWPGWPDRLRALLREARRVRSYDTIRLPRPVWTAAYADYCRGRAADQRLARALDEAFTLPIDDVEHGPDPALQAVVDERALWSRMDPAVMRGQIDHLLRLIDRGRLHLGIIPLQAEPITHTPVLEILGRRHWVSAEEEPAGTWVLYSGPLVREDIARQLDHTIARGTTSDQTRALLQEARTRYSTPDPPPAPL